MAEKLAAEDFDATVAHRLVGLYDCESDEYLEPPDAGGESWVRAGESRVLLLSPEDIYKVRISFELWENEPAILEDCEWTLTESVELYLPSARIGVFNFVGFQADVFDLDRPGRYQLRLAWRTGKWDPERHDPQAFALAQFWS